MDTQVVRYIHSRDHQFAYVDHWVAHSPVARSAAHKSLAATALVGLLVVLFGWALLRSWAPLAGGAVAMAWLVTQHEKAFRARVRRDSGVVASEADDLSLGKEQRVAAGPDGVRVTSPASDCTMPWPAVKSIESGADYAFLTIGQIRAIVIPRAGLIEGDFDAFVAAARRWHSAPG